MYYNLLSTVYAVDTLEPIVKWLTIGLLIAMTLASIILFFIDKSLCVKLIKKLALAFLVYAVAIGALMLILEITKHYNPTYLEDNWVNSDIVPYVFVPVLTTLCAILISSVILFIISKRKPQLIKKTTTACGIICGALLIYCIISIALFYTNNIKGDGYYTDGYGNLNSGALYGICGGLILLIIVFALIIGRKDHSGFDTKCISFAGVCIALSFALSFIRIWKMPQGGSITLVSMLPIMLFSYVYGAKKGVLIGLIYGLLQAVQDPFIVHPAQFLLDYPVAFALIGFTGALKEINVFENLPQVKFAISSIIGALLRFLAHVLSGVFAFGAYAMDAGISNFWAYSLAYNSFVFIDLAIVIVVGLILFSSKSFVKEMQRINLSK